ncbi:MAG: helix-hairpin-helix domain-containing protein [Syntrophales bacterium]|nr:helix-hairpin-helix domain-containing protein [Syntrophales bacterium]MDD5531511.1 helix-hairpin-helix domain-containing protein [Syntrophales bacterium]
MATEKTVDLNSASRDELEEALGEECMRKIMRYRSEHGAIESFEDLEETPGFTPQIMDTLKRGGTIVQP